MTDSFVFYASFQKALSKLDGETYKEVMTALCDYAFTGKEPKCDGVVYMAFELMKPQIDANNRRRENGKKGGRPKTETKPKETEGEPNKNLIETKPKPNVTNAEPNANVNVNVNANVNEKGKANKRFAPPTVDDVKAYADEKGYIGFDVDKFVDYYTSNGWMVGRNKMKDWKAAVRNWHSRDKTDKKASGTKFNNFTQRTDSLDELFRKGMIG